MLNQATINNIRNLNTHTTKQPKGLCEHSALLDVEMLPNDTTGRHTIKIAKQALNDHEAQVFIAMQAKLMCDAIAQRMDIDSQSHIVTSVAAAGQAVYLAGGDGRAIYEAIRHDAEILLKRHQVKTIANRLIDKASQYQENPLFFMQAL